MACWKIEALDLINGIALLIIIWVLSNAQLFSKNTFWWLIMWVKVSEQESYAVDTLHKKRIFVLQKFVKKDKKKSFFLLVFVCSRFRWISYFLNFPSNKNVGKQHFSTNAYSLVNMVFSYTIAVRKDVVLYRKQATFC